MLYLLPHLIPLTSVMRTLYSLLFAAALSPFLALSVPGCTDEHSCGYCVGDSDCPKDMCCSQWNFCGKPGTLDSWGAQYICSSPYNDAFGAGDRVTHC